MNGNLFIVLPTYNGAKHLSRQIVSIQAQTFSDWQLLLRDDGSSDETRELLTQIASKDDRIELLEDIQGNLGPVGSFSRLLEEALLRGAGYIAFSDQDDVWLPDKLAICIARMRNIEQLRGTDTPVLLHTDLEIVSESLEMISPSFMAYENIGNPGQVPINVLLIQNHVVGCTILCNRALAKEASPIPPSVRMHDWWLAAYSVVSGVLSYIPVATVRYRQHSGNTLGVGGFDQVFSPMSATWRRRIQKRPELQRSTARLATILVDRTLGLPSTPEKKVLLECRSCLRKRWWLARVRCAYNAGMKGQNWVSSLIFYVLL